MGPRSKPSREQELKPGTLVPSEGTVEGAQEEAQAL
jgi:hypothetical protein